MVSTNKPLGINTRKYRRRLGVHKPYSARELDEYKTLFNRISKPKTLRNIMTRAYRRIRNKIRTYRTRKQMKKQPIQFTDEDLRAIELVFRHHIPIYY